MTNPQQIIERLASKELSFGCELEDQEGRKFKFICDHVGWEGETVVSLRTSRGLIQNIDALADELEFEYGWKILGHPVYIGDVLAKMYSPTNEELGKLYDLWKEAACEFDDELGWKMDGMKKSLQQIVEASGFEIGCEGHEVGPGMVEGCKEGCIEELKNQQARALFEFLDPITK